MDVTFGPDLAERHFGAAELGDRRRTRRLVRTARHILGHPSGTLPQKMSHDWGEMMGLYRLVESDEVTHAAVLEPHRRRTRAAMADHPGVVLLIHDATELDYSHCAALRDQLGQVGAGHGWGYIAHHVLAVTPQGEVLGLAHQALHKRRRVSKRETRSQTRAHPARESRLWVAGCEATGTPPPGSPATWVDVADRGSDTIEFLVHAHAHAHAHGHGHGRWYVIRSAKDRVLSGDDHLGDDRVHRYLHQYARDLPELGRRQIDVSAQAGGQGKARRATVAVAAAPVTLAPNRWSRDALDARRIDTWVIRVAEVDPPPAAAAAGVEPLEWILLSNLPSAAAAGGATFEQAARCVDFYACRPMVEDYHKGQKSGMGIEQLRFAHADRLEPMIALLSVTTALLMRLRQAARRADAQTTPARTVVPLIVVQVLAAKLFGQTRDDLSVREFLYGVARLGGHLGRKHDGPPGWLTLWRGWNDLQLMVQGVEALRRFSG